MKAQAKQVNEKYPAPKHLFTNLEFKSQATQEQNQVPASQN